MKNLIFLGLLLGVFKSPTAFGAELRELFFASFALDGGSLVLTGKDANNAVFYIYIGPPSNNRIEKLVVNGRDMEDRDIITLVESIKIWQVNKLEGRTMDELLEDLTEEPFGQAASTSQLITTMSLLELYCRRIILKKAFVSSVCE